MIAASIIACAAFIGFFTIILGTIAVSMNKAPKHSSIAPVLTITHAQQQALQQARIQHMLALQAQNNAYTGIQSGLLGYNQRAAMSNQNQANTALTTALTTSQISAYMMQQHIAALTAQYGEPTIDLAYDNTFGWRSWIWSPIAKKLMSPSQGTIWNEAELHCAAWDENATVRGLAGIHARLVPQDWTKATSSEVRPSSDWQHHGPGQFSPPTITGIVERFGRFVLGTEGWRAEWVVIRKLHAPSTDIGLALEAAYPDVEIVYEDR